jgi:hypothetical protein
VEGHAAPAFAAICDGAADVVGDIMTHRRPQSETTDSPKQLALPTIEEEKEEQLRIDSPLCPGP